MLRDLYVRGKYRDVILPMTVLRRLDAVLEPTKKAVLEMKASLDKAGIVDQRLALCQAAGQSFYNTANFTLRDLRSRASQQQLKADFEAYLDGYSPNVQEIIDNFEFRNQIPRLSKADALGTLIEKLLSSEINLSPKPVLNGDGSVKHPGLDNHAMGTIFEELVRRFNEENNERPASTGRLAMPSSLWPISFFCQSQIESNPGHICFTTAPAALAECSPWVRRPYNSSRSSTVEKLLRTSTDRISMRKRMRSAKRIYC